MNRIALAATLLAIGLGGAAYAASQKLGEPLGQRSPEKVYSSTCGYCHGTNVGPILLGRKLPADYVKDMVRSGRNAMPAFRPTEINPAELDALSKWIETAPANPKEKGK